MSWASTCGAQSGAPDPRPLSSSPGELTLERDDVSLETVLKLLSRKSSIDLVAATGLNLEARCSFHLRSATLVTALELLTATFDLRWIKLDSKTILLVPAGSRVSVSSADAVGSSLSQVRDQGVGQAVAAVIQSDATVPVQSVPPPAGESTADEPPIIPDAPPVFAWAGPGESHVGATVDLRLTLNSSVPVRALPLEVEFDQQHLQLLEITEGEYFRQKQADTSFSVGRDEETGAVRVGILRTPLTGARGLGPVLTIRFKAVRPGEVNVTLTKAHAMGVDISPPAPVLPVRHTLTIR